MSMFDRETRRGARLSTAALFACVIWVLLLAASASAATNWLDPADLSKPGRNASNPALATDDAGNTVAIWERGSISGPSINLQMSTRSPGGAFTAPVEFANAGSGSDTEPRLAIAPSGTAVAVWKHFETLTGTYVVLAAFRPPGGSFGAPSTVYTAEKGVFLQELEAAIGAGGGVAVTWSRTDPGSGLDKIICGYAEPPDKKPFNCRNPPFVEASVSPAGGSFTPMGRISPPRGKAPEPPEPAETPEQKVEREKAESFLAADDARPAVDGAGNAIVVWSFFDGTNAIVQSAVSEAAGSFTAPARVSESGADAGPPEIGVDAAGTATATWIRTEGTEHVVQAGVRPPGGSFSLLGDLSGAGASEAPSIDVAPNGGATVLWRVSGNGETFLQTATRAPGGAFAPPVSVNNGKDNPLFAELAADASGDAVVVWSGDNGPEKIARAAVREGGGFSAPVAISKSSPNYFHPLASIDSSGNATAVWVRDNGANSLVQEAGYDAGPPQLSGVVVPSSAKVGDQLQFSATASDAWPLAAPSFNFGDGSTALGNTVTHAYSHPGSYAVTIAATDGVGRTTTSAATVLVKARNFFKLGKLKTNAKKGTATLTVTIPEPGAIAVSGKGIKRTIVRAAKAGAVEVPIKAVGKGLKRLRKTGRLKARLKVDYSPLGGETSTQRARVTLRKKQS